VMEVVQELEALADLVRRPPVGPMPDRLGTLDGARFEGLSSGSPSKARLERTLAGSYLDVDYPRPNLLYLQAH
jgi:hypothetical protein